MSVTERIEEEQLHPVDKDSVHSFNDIKITIQQLDNVYFKRNCWECKPDSVYLVHSNGDSTLDLFLGKNYVKANKIIITNFTDTNLIVLIEDGQLPLVQEAQDEQGTWKPIEYFMHSDCGNSYSAIKIPSNMYFENLIARYCGEFKTKLRVRLEINEEFFYSNEFEGYINLGQFSN